MRWIIIGIAAVVALGVAVTVTINVLITSRVKRKLEFLLAEEEEKNPDFCAKAMVRIGCVECPGVVTVSAGTLSIIPVFGDPVIMPLSSAMQCKCVQLIAYGKYYWWGTRVVKIMDRGTGVKYLLGFRGDSGRFVERLKK
ncbi:MAG: hypothetical protein AB7F40_09360 [Victivallaceae bacterium]|nr:hypothetical protein [Victivallaceae bacterium]